VNVRFDGNHALTDADVRATLTNGAAHVRRDEFERGVLLLTAAYYDKGYVRVRTDVAGTPDDAVVHITEGERFRLSAFDVVEIDREGKRTELLPAAAALPPEVARSVGDWFNRGALVAWLQKLRHTYQDAGFANVEADPETALDVEHQQVRVFLPIHRGELVRVSEVRVVGLKGTPEALVRREIDIAPNDVFSASRLEAARKRLGALGRFRRVDVSTQSGGSVVVFELEDGV
jgi:outer membrane protein insertion porin family